MAPLPGKKSYSYARGEVKGNEDERTPEDPPSNEVAQQAPDKANGINLLTRSIPQANQNHTLFK